VKYPAILTDEIADEQATVCFADAQQMLAIILKERNSLLKVFMAFSIIK
jgi:hypothetical protein